MGGRRVDGMALGSVQVTARRKPSSPPCPRQLSDSPFRARTSSTHTAHALSQSRVCARVCVCVCVHVHSAPVSLGYNTRAFRGVVGCGVQDRCAQLNWTEVGPLAAFQGECGSDGVKIGPEIHHSCDTTVLAKRVGSSHRTPDTQGCLLFQLREAQLRLPPSRGQCPPRTEPAPLNVPCRGLVLPNRGSGSWPR